MNAQDRWLGRMASRTYSLYITFSVSVTMRQSAVSLWMCHDTCIVSTLRVPQDIMRWYQPFWITWSIPLQKCWNCEKLGKKKGLSNFLFYHCTCWFPGTVRCWGICTGNDVQVYILDWHWKGAHYHQTSNIRCTESQNLNVSCLFLQLSLLNPLKPGVKSRMKI